MKTTETLKVGVSITEMAKMLCLSRSRCYQLIEEGIFFPPVYDTETHRPFFPPEIQTKNLEIRRRNQGANGKPILFYARRFAMEPVIKKMPVKKATLKTQKDSINERLMSDLKALGIDCPNPVHIESALKENFPTGIKDIDESEVLRCVYRFLRRQNSKDNVER